MSEPLDPRVAELLSAELDGATTPEEREAARLWVERSPAARAERASLAAVQAALRALPEVDPPPGFFEAMLAAGSPRVAAVVPLRRRTVAGAAAAAVATAAAWVALAGSGAAAAVTPPVADVEAALHGGGRAGVDLVRAGGGRAAMLRQDGDLVWRELPDGVRGTHGGADTWVDLTADPGVARVVVTDDHEVVTLVSEDLGPEVLVAVGVAELGDRGFLDRLRRACESLLGA